MRLDVFLKLSRLVGRRSLAQEFCEAGLIEIGGVKARSSKEVRVGDRITVRKRDSAVTVEVKEIPTQKQVSKADAPKLFEIVATAETPLS